MHTHPVHSRIVDPKGQPTKNLLELLSLLGVENDGSLAGIVRATQERFFQRHEDGRAKERWELDEIVPDTPVAASREITEERAQTLRERCMDILNELRLLDKVPPCWKSYDYALLLGGLVTRVRGRLVHLAKLWSNGCPEMRIAYIRPEAMVFLGGERPLLPDKESMEVLLDSNNGVLPFRKGWTFSGDEPRTELEMMQLVWDQADIPNEMRELPVTWVNAQMKTDPDDPTGKRTTRPNTGDTIATWLADYDPSPGHCLAISNQPHVAYQDAVLRTCLPTLRFTIETIGTAASLDHQLAFYLRELAGWLRQVKILQDRGK